MYRLVVLYHRNLPVLTRRVDLDNVASSRKLDRCCALLYWLSGGRIEPSIGWAATAVTDPRLPGYARLRRPLLLLLSLDQENMARKVFYVREEKVREKKSKKHTTWSLEGRRPDRNKNSSGVSQKKRETSINKWRTFKRQQKVLVGRKYSRQ